MKVIRAFLCRLLACVIPVGAVVGWGETAAAQDQAVRYAEQMPLADETLVLDAATTEFGAVAVGARGHVLLSSDLVEWRQAEKVPTRAVLTAVDFVGEQGWAVGHDSVILHSADEGVTWERQYIDPERRQPFMDVLFLDARRGYAVGAYDLFMVTEDGGRTWRDTGGIDEMNDWHLNDILRTEDGTWLIAAEQGLVYRSTDGARSWESVQLPYEGSMFGILETSPNTVLTFGLRGRAFRSSDGGRTWEPVDTDTDSSLFGGRVLQSGRVVLVGGGGTVTSRPAGGGPFVAREHGEGESLAGLLQARDGRFVYYGITGIGPDPDEGGTD